MNISVLLATLGVSPYNRNASLFERDCMRLHSYRPFVALLILVVLGALLVGCQGVQTVTPAPGANTSDRFPRPSPASRTTSTSSTSATAVAPSTQRPRAAPQTMPTSPASVIGQPTATDAAGDAPAFTATGQPSAANELVTIEWLDKNLPPRRDQVQLAHEFGRAQSLEHVARTKPLDVQVGDKERFNLVEFSADPAVPARHYTITATLVLALEHALVYVEDGIEVDLEALKRSAREFNDKIYPHNRELFGSEWSPGVDGDPRLTILNARIPGVGGYFSSNDTVPKSVNRFSNEREMFYINIEARRPGTDSYGDVLAHEFQHMIQWNEAEHQATWFDEGMSQLAEELNGYAELAADVAPAYLANPDRQLTTWVHHQAALPHYGASYLFMTYFYEQYGKDLDLKDLIRQGASERLELFAELAHKQNPNIQDFGDLYADWAIANLINNAHYGDGRYAYMQLPSTAPIQPLSNDNTEEEVAQFGSDYWELPASDQERVIRFDGSDTAGVVAAEPEGNVMWWSNRSDNAYTTLTRTFDLRDVPRATLQFRLWFDIEQDFDYGFVSVSTDGGQTFSALPGRYTTTDDPLGANWGNGYTGTSGGGSSSEWVDEEIDLTSYAGQEIVLRFSLITDDATNKPGMVLDNIRIPEIGFSDDVETDAARWAAQGFARTDNRLAQRWEVRLIRIDGNKVTFEPLQHNPKNVGEYRLAPGQRGALIVAATTPHTTERAMYQLAVTHP
jgi:immune inhibitor A